MSYIDTYKSWLSSEYIDSATKEELKQIEGNEKEIEDRFYKDLEFGTGGLRGVIGAGTNRLNIYTVRKRQLRGLQILLFHRMVRIKVWRLLLIPDICLLNFQKKRRYV